MGVDSHHLTLPACTSCKSWWSRRLGPCAPVGIASILHTGLIATPARNVTTGRATLLLGLDPDSFRFHPQVGKPCLLEDVRSRSLSAPRSIRAACALPGLQAIARGHRRKPTDLSG